MRPFERYSPLVQRLALCICAGDPSSPMTRDGRTLLRRQCLDLRWGPTPEDTPLNFDLVELWLRQYPGIVASLDQWEAHLAAALEKALHG